MPGTSSFLVRLRLAALELGLPGKRILVACSGGKDSVALLIGLRELGGALGFELEVATVDHQLRAESARDADFVEHLAGSLGLACTRRRVQVRGDGGLEAAARRARYRALEQVATERGCSLIATGHTLEDQAETVLLRLGRGTGTRGLRGILARRGRVVRPLLGITRAEVADYLQSCQVSAREDPTNASPRFARNRVRANVLPALRDALGEGAVASVARFAAAAGDDERLLSRLARRHARRLLETLPDGFAGDVAALARLDPALQTRVLRLGARRAGLRLGLRHALEMRQALASRRPKRVGLPGGARLEVRHGRFELHLSPPAPAAGFDVPLAAPGETELEGARVVVREVDGPAPAAPGAVRLDPAQLALPLRLRTRRPGDRFRARGGREKKLKSWLIDQKLAADRRAGLWLLADSAGRVLWLVGLRDSQQAALGERAERAWEVEVRLSGSSGASHALSSREPAILPAGTGAEEQAEQRPATSRRGPK